MTLKLTLEQSEADSFFFFFFSANSTNSLGVQGTPDFESEDLALGWAPSLSPKIAPSPHCLPAMKKAWAHGGWGSGPGPRAYCLRQNF